MKLSSLLLALLPGLASAALDPNALIKVDKENNQHCIEYYQYKGDLYCSTTALSQGPLEVNPLTDEKQKIAFDARPWVAGWGKKSDNITTIEYVPSGESVNSWNELVTSQYLPGIQSTAMEFAQSVIEKLKQTGLHPIIKILSKTPDQVIFEFQISSPANMRQNEIQKITKGPKGIYVLHYAIRQPDMGEKNRNKWLKNMSNSQIKQ